MFNIQPIKEVIIIDSKPNDFIITDLFIIEQIPIIIKLKTITYDL